MDKFSGNPILIGTILLLALSIALYGCGGGGRKEDSTEKGKEEKQAMKLVSEAFESGESIPAKYTCTGVDDPDAPSGVFDHWLIWNIPPDTHEIPEGIAQQEKVNELDGAVQGRNDFGELGYRGPCPPKGPAHEYRFRLYGLDEKLDLEPGSTKDKLEKAIKGLVIEKASLTGVYSRSG